MEDEPLGNFISELDSLEQRGLYKYEVRMDVA